MTDLRADPLAREDGLPRALPTGVAGTLYPAVMALGLAIGWLAIERAMPRIVAIGVPSVLASLVLFGAERRWPFRAAWRRYRGDLRTDLAHAVVAGVLVPGLVDAGLRALVLEVAEPLAAHGLALWPSHLPLVAQLALALVVSELFLYWSHRLSHEVPFLWRFHAVHHSSERLYFLNSNRFHPVDAALTTVVFVAPLSLLGVGPEVLVLHTIVNAINGAFKHGNVGVRLGPLNWLVSLGELHRWHHSTEREEASHNYGTNLIVWDVIFGTRFLPRDREPPEEVGLGPVGYPQRYLAQLLEPLTPGRRSS